MSTGGMIYVHSSPSAVCPHVEWAIAGVVATRVDLQWTAQAAAAGQLRAECQWTGSPGTAASVVSALRAWPMLRFEVTEDPSPGIDGERFCCVPGLGLWRARSSANGGHRSWPGGLRASARPAPGGGLGRRAGTVPARWRRSPGDLVAPRGLRAPATVRPGCTTAGCCRGRRGLRGRRRVPGRGGGGCGWG